MKDLIFVTAHCPTEEQIKRLRRCINLLSASKGFDLALISHTHTPIDIQKKCNYYIYDHLNDLDDDDDLKHFEYHHDKEFDLKSKYFRKNPFYGFSIYRMFAQISALAVSLGYTNIHHVEYDYLIYDLNILENNKKKLQKSDAVFYIKSIENKLIVGGLKSFKVDKLPQLFKIYDKEKIKSKILNEDLLPLEQFTKKIFLDCCNCAFILWSDFDSKMKISRTQFESQEINWSPYYNIKDDTIGIIYFNKNSPNSGKNEFIDYKTNLGETNIYLQPATHTIRNLGKAVDIKWIEVFRNKTSIFKYNITPEFTNKLKINAPFEPRENN